MHARLWSCSATAAGAAGFPGRQRAWSILFPSTHSRVCGYRRFDWVQVIVPVVLPGLGSLRLLGRGAGVSAGVPGSVGCDCVFALHVATLVLSHTSHTHTLLFCTAVPKFEVTDSLLHWALL